MILLWEMDYEVLEKISLTNRGWYTREAEMCSSTYISKASCDCREVDDSVP